ncbi:MAG TPA: hypothetical protein VMR81_04800 [Patescibacteria group bacterium]|nr:hypothetical protein [Patescibacteria group bacterium]
MGNADQAVDIFHSTKSQLAAGEIGEARDRALALVPQLFDELFDPVPEMQKLSPVPALAESILTNGLTSDVTTFIDTLPPEGKGIDARIPVVIAGGEYEVQYAGFGRVELGSDGIFTRDESEIDPEQSSFQVVVSPVNGESTRLSEQALIMFTFPKTSGEQEGKYLKSIQIKEAGRNLVFQFKPESSVPASVREDRRYRIVHDGITREGYIDALLTPSTNYLSLLGDCTISVSQHMAGNEYETNVAHLILSHTNDGKGAWHYAVQAISDLSPITGMFEGDYELKLEKRVGKESDGLWFDKKNGTKGALVKPKGVADNALWETLVNGTSGPLLAGALSDLFDSTMLSKFGGFSLSQHPDRSL